MHGLEEIKQMNAPKQHIPELFLEIMRHDALRPEAPYTGSNVLYPWTKWCEHIAKLNAWKQRHQELLTAAEKALQWNHNKGSTE